jgi:mono/diheme cytochrome c family protein
MKTLLWSLSVSALIATSLLFGVRANESNIVWEHNDAAVLVQSRCSICHSLDYILMNAGFMKSSGWEAEVNKMRKVFGAPISEDEAKQITEYLSDHFAVKN